VLWSIIATGTLLVLGLELFGKGEWFIEEGYAHIVAVGFAFLAAGRLLARKLTADSEFRPVAIFGVFSMAAIAITHGLEYAGEFVISIPHGSEGMLFMNIYSVGLLGLILGFERIMRTMRRSGVWIQGLFFMLMIALVALTYNIFYPRGYTFTPNPLSDLLYLCMFTLLTLLTVSVIRRACTVFTVLRSFGRHLYLAIGLVYVSVLPEVFMGHIERLGIPEWRIELIAHYLVYAGLFTFYLAFERLRHFGGIYEELEMEELNGKKDSGSGQA
jgi:hypothetical protein